MILAKSEPLEQNEIIQPIAFKSTQFDFKVQSAYFFSVSALIWNLLAFKGAQNDEVRDWNCSIN